MGPLSLTFYGATETVTGSRYLLREGEKCFLVDCGLFQGLKALRQKNWDPFPLPPEQLDGVLLSHAHIDHSGYLPLLVKQGYQGPIYCSEATYALCRILLPDSGRIHEEDARRANLYGYSKHTPALPLYTEEDARQALKLFQTVDFGVSYKLSERFSFHFSRAGHILGSAMITFRHQNKTLVFTGDLGRPNNPVMNPPAVIQEADYLVLDGTYGHRTHPEENPQEELGKIIERTAAKGGTVLIPAFAVGRTQTILYYLYQLKLSGKLEGIPVYLDSPMAQDATDIMNHFTNEHGMSEELCAQVCQLAHYARTPEESQELHGIPHPKVIISASGMAEGGRVLHHLKVYGPDSKNAVVFAGFQAAGTRGEKILSGAASVKIHGEMIPMRAHVQRLESLSSHSDVEETLQWLAHFRSQPRSVFLTHGESEALASLKKSLEKKLSWRCVIPTYGQEERL